MTHRVNLITSIVLNYSPLESPLERCQKFIKMLPFGCSKRGALLLGYAVCSLSLGLIYASTCTEWKGGKSGIHAYVCCNNCRNGIVDDADECNRYTYHGGSDESYCGDCGVPAEDADGSRNKIDPYPCLGCSVQKLCEHYCDGEGFDIKGLCYGWRGCFRRCCNHCAKQAQNRTRVSRSSRKWRSCLQKQKDRSCGDGICQIFETPTSCPLDCCDTSLIAC